MRPKDRERAAQFQRRLLAFAEEKHPLPGLVPPGAAVSFVEQILESLHRIEYVHLIRQRPLGPGCANPQSDLFDPIKASIVLHRNGELDEACWLIFLATHFGKHRQDGWRLVRDVYGGYRDASSWTWHRTSAGLGPFRDWWVANEKLFQTDGMSRRFGNHRKYESLRSGVSRSTPNVVTSYVGYVGANRGHAVMFAQAGAETKNDRFALFDYLYNDLERVVSFGRTARFDFLTMLGKVGLAPIEPGRPYFDGATGPLAGSRLLFLGATDAIGTAAHMEELTIVLGNYLGVGMQVMEDSLCNWQKSPTLFQPFRG